MGGGSGTRQQGRRWRHGTGHIFEDGLWSRVVRALATAASSVGEMLVLPAENNRNV